MIGFSWISAMVTVLWKGVWNELQGADTIHHAHTRALERVGRRGSIGGVRSQLSVFASRIVVGVLRSGPNVLTAFSMVVDARQRLVVYLGKDTL
jgi:hypothetical protein